MKRKRFLKFTTNGSYVQKSNSFGEIKEKRRAYPNFWIIFL